MYSLIKAILDSLLQWFKPEIKKKGVDADEKSNQMRSIGSRIHGWESGMLKNNSSKRSKPDTYGSTVQDKDLHATKRRVDKI